MMNNNFPAYLAIFLIGCAGGEPTTNSAEPVVEPSGTPPVGSIGGEPILPTAVVVGGVSNQAVEDSVEANHDAIAACYDGERLKKPGLAGKVLVRFIIDANGTVSSVATKSSSLRHPATEACLEGVIKAATFPELLRGKRAIVTYPFVFPL
jgi:TonB family protein